jgi:PTS system N-acetylglucosamine-specific IIC component
VNVHDDSLIDEDQIKSSGVHGIAKPGKNNVQVVVGTEVEHVAEEMKRLL